MLAVHREFELEKPARARVTYSDLATAEKRTDASTVVDRLQHMEDLTIEGVVLDQSQARVTMALVADQPGIAARIFEAVAAEDVLVDMIVQSMGIDGYANVSFTVPRKSVDQARSVVGKLAAELGGSVTHEPEIDILCLLYTSPSPRDGLLSRMPSSA